MRRSMAIRKPVKRKEGAKLRSVFYRRLAAAVALLWMVVALTGCWSRQELNDRVFVTLMFLDEAEDGKIELSLGFPLINRMTPGQVTGSIGGQYPYTVISASGVNVMEAYYKIQLDVPRVINWGQVRAIIIGEKFTRGNLDSLTEFLVRQPSFRLRTYMLSVDGKAKDYAYMTPIFERFPSEIVREFSHMGLSLSVHACDLLISQLRNSDLLIPRLYLDELPMLSEKGRKTEFAGTGGATIYKRNKRVGTLDKHDTLMAMILKNQVMSSVVTVETLNEGAPVSLMLTKSRTTIKPVIADGQVTMRIAVELCGDLHSSESRLNVSTAAGLSKLEQAYNRYIEKELVRVIGRTKAVKADVFKFGQLVQWHDPKLWTSIKDDWDDLYANSLDVEVKATVTIKRLGAEQASIR